MGGSFFIATIFLFLTIFTFGSDDKDLLVGYCKVDVNSIRSFFEKKLDASESHEGRDGKSKMVLWSRVGKDIDANNNGSDL